jgi:hypothetical protein
MMNQLIKSFLDDFYHSRTPREINSDELDFLALLYDYCWEWDLGYNDEIEAYVLTLKRADCYET